MMIKLKFTDDDQQREYYVEGSQFHPAIPGKSPATWVFNVYRRIVKEKMVRTDYIPPKVQSSNQKANKNE